MGDLPSQESNNWIATWRHRTPSNDKSERIGLQHDLAQCLQALLRHYPSIVFLGFSFWRKMLIMRPAPLHPDSQEIQYLLQCKSSSPDGKSSGSTSDPEKIGKALALTVAVSGSLKAANKLPTAIISSDRTQPLTPTEFEAKRAKGDWSLEEFTGIFMSTLVTHGQTDIVSVFLRDLRLDLLEFQQGVQVSNPLHRVIHDAIEGRHHAMLRLIVEESHQDIAQVGRHPSCDDTPLMAAAACGNTEAVTLLIEHGASVMKAGKKGRTPLHAAQTVNVAELLLHHGADVNKANSRNNQTPIFHAKWRVVEVFLAHDAHVNACDSFGRTPLHYLTCEKSAELMLLHGANVNARDESGDTPLHASTYAPPEIQKLLLSKGASLAARNKAGQTPLVPFVTADSVDGVKLLLDLAQERQEPDLDYSPQVLSGLLHHVRSKEMVNLLMSHGCGFTVDAKGKTALHHLCQSHHKNVVPTMEALLTHGVDAEAVDHDGRTALHYAAAEYPDEKLALLLKKGVNVNAKNTVNGGTPLHVATSGAARLLVEAGADLFIKDDAGRIPSASRKVGHSTTVEYLLEQEEKAGRRGKSAKTSESSGFRCIVQ